MNSNEDAYLFFETKYWKVILANDQTYVGRIVAPVKRPVASLAELSAEEWVDAHFLIQKFEAAARNALGATLFNWGCLMNHAFRTTPPNPHVHWHCRPRYNHPVMIGGMQFNDPNFASHYTDGLMNAIPHEVMMEIITRLSREMHKSP